MRFAIAALVFIILLFAGGVGWVTTSFLMDVVDDETTSSERLEELGRNASQHTGNVAILRLGFNVFWVIYFLVLIILFVVDSLRREPEQYLPGDMRRV